MNHDDNSLPEKLSKTDRKKLLVNMLELARELVGLKDGEFNALTIDEELRTEAETARKIKSHSARARQLKYLAQILHNMDREELEETISNIRIRNQSNTEKFHELEKLRDELVAGGDEVIAKIVSRFPQTDQKKLKTLQSNAKSAGAGVANPNAPRMLFRYLRALAETTDP